MIDRNYLFAHAVCNHAYQSVDMNLSEIFRGRLSFQCLDEFSHNVFVGVVRFGIMSFETTGQLFNVPALDQLVRFPSRTASDRIPSGGCSQLLLGAYFLAVAEKGLFAEDLLYQLVNQSCNLVNFCLRACLYVWRTFFCLMYCCLAFVYVGR
ncbi:Hypothetical_protein [Hexamita inflata]|uniref:Hypothetical_protein n=1 Tax=Hexamita inflata TaxID=28002 RepID=A0AA86UI88_9EUKA|nr:Hypothetical protein HINF_LOCUS39887 [Hexamita inflata]